MPPVARPLDRRFDEMTQKSGSCWLWTGGLTRDGYGVFWVNRKQRRPAHRWSYEHFVGPIPEGLQIDHLCRVRRCVNPDHLEPVTNRENILRGDTFAAANGRKTHCPKGHPYEGENLYEIRGERRCRACNRAAALSYQRRWYGAQAERVNKRRRELNAIRAASRPKKTHCRHGHELTEGNQTPYRRCRSCSLDAKKRYRARRAADS
jgi:hypothetical protein